MGVFDELINQIDAFIRKYYKNQMIKGVLLFLIFFLVSFLIVTGLEYVGRFNSFVRGVLLFSFIGVNTYILVKYFITPLSKLFSFGKRINRYQAAKIIGDFFTSVDDKLLNTLQLQDTAKSQPRNLEFLQASIAQNAKQLNTFTFTSAIDYSANKKFLKYFVPVLFTVVIIGMIFPNLFSEGSERLIKYNQVFEMSPDFNFTLQNKDLLIEEGGNITIEVKVKSETGKPIPDRIYIESSEGNFLMKKTNKNQAAYTFNNLNNNVDFKFKAFNAQSAGHTINVVKRTTLGHLKVDIHYPKYLNRSSETIENPGDLILPNGTQLEWNGVTKNSKKLTVLLKDSLLEFKESGFRFNHSVLNSTDLLFVLQNEKIDKADSVKYHIDVIRDEYPSISVNRREDSIVKNKIYFSGSVSDDYGVSQLVFTYVIENAAGEKATKNITVPGIQGNQSPFSMTFNLSELGLELKDRVTYFFTVYDNDGINGPKATKSTVFQYSSPSLEELHDKRKEDKNKATEDLKELLRETQEFKEEMSRLKKEIANSKKTTWQQQKQLQHLKEQQQALNERLDQMKEQMKSSFEEKNKLDPADERLLEKQKQLEEMLEKVMDDELKRLLEELQKMLEEQKDNNLLEKLEDTEMSAEEMERQLDRTMEMLKQMDVEERVEDLTKSLEQLADDQDQLKENLENLSKEEAMEEQEKLNERFDDLKDDLKEMLEKNEELQRPMFFDGIDELMEEISESMEGAQQDIQDGNSGGASQQQQDASEKMEQAASQLQAQMQSSQQQQQEEDYAAMRALIENLIRLSFDQEENMVAFKETDGFDPHFVTLGQEQRAIMDNFNPVKDSLRALAQRIPQISSFIEQEVGNIEKQYRYIPTHIGERQKRELGMKQQFAMTSINNLALFMNEAMEQALQAMQGNMSGDGDCDNPGQGQPGQGKPGKGKSGQGQDGEMDGLKDMIKKQLEQMKKGNGEGGNQPNQKPGGVLPINSQQAAKMAAEQNAIQQKLQELREQMNKDGSGEGNQLNELLKELEKQQEDLINKNWNTELIDRQQEILTRLLESEKAMRERDWDEKRESNTGKDENFGNQIEFLEYKKQKEKQIELLRTLDPSFSQYYKDKSNAYFLTID